MSRDWSAMTREELLVEKGMIENQVQAVKAELTRARRGVAMGLGHMPTAQYDEIVERNLRLGRALRRIQTEIAKRNADRRAASTTLTFDQAFRRVAKLILEQDLYDEIHTAADDMVSAEGGK
jgi:predicted NBD/HSP70 family sugar kinase